MWVVVDGGDVRWYMGFDCDEACRGGRYIEDGWTSGTSEEVYRVPSFI